MKKTKDTAQRQRYAMFQDRLHEYTLTVDTTPNGDLYTLHYSEALHWVEDLRGQKILALIDTGNEVRFSRGRKRVLDYSDLAAEAALLSAYDTLTGGSLSSYDMVSLASFAKTSKI